MSEQPVFQGEYHPPQDERTFACIAHLSIFVSTIGLFIAAGLWLFLRKKHPYAAYQAAQAFLFQLLTMFLMLFVIVSFLAIFFGAFGLGLASGVNVDSNTFAAFAVAVGLGIAALAVLFSLALYAYAIYAAIRSYQGREFRIPGIGLIADAISPMPTMTRTTDRQNL